MMKLRELAAKCGAAAERLNRRIFNCKNSEKNALTDVRAEAYVGEAVKILIAVVIGALLLTLTYSLMKDTVFATVTQKIKELFAYSA